MLEWIILLFVFLLCLFIIPLGLPGIWVMIAAAVGYDLLVPGPERIGWFTIVAVTALAAVAEILEFTLAGRYTKKFGGSRRAAWWAIFGGIVGALIGVPLPIIGSVIGAFIGAFAGAWLGEYTRGETTGVATRAATGALLGRAVASALKVAIGVVMMVWLLVAAWL